MQLIPLNSFNLIVKKLGKHTSLKEVKPLYLMALIRKIKLSQYFYLEQAFYVKVICTFRASHYKISGCSVRFGFPIFLIFNFQNCYLTFSIVTYFLYLAVSLSFLVLFIFSLVTCFPYFKFVTSFVQSFSVTP